MTTSSFLRAEVICSDPYGLMGLFSLVTQGGGNVRMGKYFGRSGELLPKGTLRPIGSPGSQQSSSSRSALLCGSRGYQAQLDFEILPPLHTSFFFLG